MFKKLSGKYKLILVLSMILSLLVTQTSFAWSGSDANSNTRGHGKLTMDAYNNANASAFKTLMTNAGMTNTLLYYAAHQDDAAEKEWVAKLDDTGSTERVIAPFDIIENDEANGMGTSVAHMSAHPRTNLREDTRLHNAVELLRNAIYWKNKNDNTRAYRNLGDGLHLIQDYFAHLNGSRRMDWPHGLDPSWLMDYNPVDGTTETRVGDAMDNLDFDCHTPVDGTSYEFSTADAYDFPNQWHIVGLNSNWSNNYRYVQAVETGIKYMNAFAAGTEADFVKALEQGYVVNGTKKTYINLLSKVVVDNKSDLCTFSGSWVSSSSTAGYWGTDYMKDATTEADASTVWAKFSTPSLVPTDNWADSYTWYNFTPGRYKIYMRWTAYSTRPDAAPVEIKHADGNSTTTVNQTVNGGVWNYLGTYRMEPSNTDPAYPLVDNYVKILATDAGVTIADAVMFVKTDDSYPISGVTYSSSSESTNWSYSKVYDGNRTSITGSYGWSSSSNLTANHTEWITADLGSSKTIGWIDLYPRNDSSYIGDGFPVDFTIQVSNDNVNWTTKVTKTAYAKPGNAVQSFSFTPQSARYLKITGTNLRTVAGSYRMQFAEIEVY